MIRGYIQAIKSSIPINSLIGIGASLGAGVLTLGLGMDTPWIPWDPLSGTFYPPHLFTIASFIATMFFLSISVLVGSYRTAFTIALSVSSNVPLAFLSSLK